MSWRSNYGLQEKPLNSFQCITCIYGLTLKPNVECSICRKRTKYQSFARKLVRDVLKELKSKTP